MTEEGNWLDGFPKTHFVSEDAVDALIVQIGEPVHAFQLVVFESAAEHGGLRALIRTAAWNWRRTDLKRSGPRLLHTYRMLHITHCLKSYEYSE